MPTADLFANPDQAVLFSKTSSPELDTHLHEILTKIILPTRLNPPTQRRLYDPKFKDTLKMNPVVIEVEGFEYKFQHMDRFDPSVPRTSHVVSSVVPLMRTPADFANLPTLLSGLRRARGPLGHRNKCRVVREAGKAGQIYSVVECASQAARTGFYLREAETVATLLYWIGRRPLDDAASGGADAEEAASRRSLAWAEKVLDLLEDPKHLEEMAKQRRPPLHEDPLVLALVLHSAAARAVRHADGQDPDGKVARYARRVARRWPAGKGLREMYRAEDYAAPRLRQFIADGRSAYLSVAATALRGLELAARVVEPELAEELRPTAEALREEIRGVVAADGGKSVEGMQAVRDLLGEDFVAAARA